MLHTKSANSVHSTAFEILVARSPGTTKTCADNLLRKLSGGQLKIYNQKSLIKRVHFITPGTADKIVKY